jgi:hypothetical protein
MIQTMDCGEARISLGVYVLGSIDPAERGLVDAHLATCRDCRDELAGLAGLPALLARVSTAEAVALAEEAPPDGEQGDEQHKEEGASEAGHPPAGAESPPKELLGTVLDLTAARRRRRQWRTAGLSAAAAVIIAAAAFGGAEAASGHGTSSPPTAAGLNYGAPISGWTTLHGSTDGMYGTVMYRQMGWGTQLAARVVGIPVGTPCQLIVVGHDGAKTVAGAWTTDIAEGTVYYPASTSVSPQDVSAFQITVAGHQVITVPV